eukprot:scaffold103380_cov21-Tisochrysis_lutea.AAC.1
MQHCIKSEHIRKNVARPPDGGCQIWIGIGCREGTGIGLHPSLQHRRFLSCWFLQKACFDATLDAHTSWVAPMQDPRTESYEGMLGQSLLLAQACSCDVI